MKKKIIIACTIFTLGFLLLGRGLLVRNVYIDVLDKGEQGYSRIELGKEDSKEIRKIICPKIAIPDKDFVFAEGNYRFVFETLGMEVHMYPYCGHPDTLRIGDKGSWLIELDYFVEDESDTVEKIVGKYMDDAGGIRDWSNVK